MVHTVQCPIKSSIIHKVHSMCNHDNVFRTNCWRNLTSTTKLFQAFHICPELGFGRVGVPWLFALALPLALAFTLAKTSLKQVKKESFSASLSRFTGKFAKLKKVLHRLYLGETAEGGTGRVDSSKSPARCTCRNTFQMLDAAISSFWASGAIQNWTTCLNWAREFTNLENCDSFFVLVRREPPYLHLCRDGPPDRNHWATASSAGSSQDQKEWNTWNHIPITLFFYHCVYII